MRIVTPYDSPAVLTSSHMRFDALFFGVLLSYLYHFHATAFHSVVNRFRYPIAAASVVAWLPAVFLEPGAGPWMTRFGLSLLYLAFGGWLALSVAECPDKNARNPGALTNALAFIGKISYSIYLWHVPVGEIWRWHEIKTLPALPTWVNSLLYILAAVLAGWVSHRFIEKPSLAWRDRKFPSRV